MEKLDRLGWAAGTCFTAYGARIGIRLNRADILERLPECLPPGWKPARSNRVDRLYSLRVGGAARGIRAFHLVYALFLWSLTRHGMRGMAAYHVSPLDLAFMAAIAISFILTHRATYQRIMAADQQGRPNIGGVMFLPYLRILPMHLTIILGVAAGYTGGVMLFAGLKMLADVLMHWIEYRITLPTVESPA